MQQPPTDWTYNLYLKYLWIIFTRLFLLPCGCCVCVCLCGRCVSLPFFDVVFMCSTLIRTPYRSYWHDDTVKKWITSAVQNYLLWRAKDAGNERITVVSIKQPFGCVCNNRKPRGRWNNVMRVIGTRLLLLITIRLLVLTTVTATTASLIHCKFKYSLFVVCLCVVDTWTTIY